MLCVQHKHQCWDKFGSACAWQNHLAYQVKELFAAHPAPMTYRRCMPMLDACFVLIKLIDTVTLVYLYFTARNMYWNFTAERIASVVLRLNADGMVLQSLGPSFFAWASYRHSWGKTNKNINKGAKRKGTSFRLSVNKKNNNTSGEKGKCTKMKRNREVDFY